MLLWVTKRGVCFFPGPVAVLDPFKPTFLELFLIFHFPLDFSCIVCLIPCDPGPCRLAAGVRCVNSAWL